jgi:hypothetical protein
MKPITEATKGVKTIPKEGSPKYKINKSSNNGQPLKNMVYMCISQERPFPPYTRPHATPTPRRKPMGAVIATSARVMSRPFAKAGTIMSKMKDI